MGTPHTKYTISVLDRQSRKTRKPPPPLPTPPPRIPRTDPIIPHEIVDRVVDRRDADVAILARCRVIASRIYRECRETDLADTESPAALREAIREARRRARPWAEGRQPAPVVVVLENGCVDLVDAILDVAACLADHSRLTPRPAVSEVGRLVRVALRSLIYPARIGGRL